MIGNRIEQPYVDAYACGIVSPYTRMPTYMREQPHIRTRGSSACALEGCRTGWEVLVRQVSSTRVHRAARWMTRCAQAQNPDLGQSLTAHASPCEGVAGHNAFCDEAGERKVDKQTKAKKNERSGKKNGRGGRAACGAIRVSRTVRGSQCP